MDRRSSSIAKYSRMTLRNPSKEESTRRDANQITKEQYEKKYWEKKQRDPSAIAVCNQYRQTLNEEGAPVVKALVEGWYSAEDPHDTRSVPRPAKQTKDFIARNKELASSLSSTMMRRLAANSISNNSSKNSSSSSNNNSSKSLLSTTNTKSISALPKAASSSSSSSSPNAHHSHDYCYHNHNRHYHHRCHEEDTSKAPDEVQYREPTLLHNHIVRNCTSSALSNHHSGGSQHGTGHYRYNQQSSDSTTTTTTTMMMMNRYKINYVQTGTAGFVQASTTPAPPDTPRTQRRKRIHERTAELARRKSDFTSKTGRASQQQPQQQQQPPQQKQRSTTPQRPSTAPATMSATRTNKTRPPSPAPAPAIGRGGGGGGIVLAVHGQRSAIDNPASMSITCLPITYAT